MWSTRSTKARDDVHRSHFRESMFSHSLLFVLYNAKTDQERETILDVWKGSEQASNLEF